MGLDAGQLQNICLVAFAVNVEDTNVLRFVLYDDIHQSLINGKRSITVDPINVKLLVCFQL